MTVYVLLLRGINVGGRNILPMKELTGMMQDLGCSNVKTYIQSGNAVFAHSKTGIAKLGGEIAAAVKKAKGFEPHCLVLSLAELEKAAADNPFPEAESDPKSLHVAFHDSKVKNPDLALYEKLRKDNERMEIRDTVGYLHAPDGIGRSKLAAAGEKIAGVTATSRNWNTVQKLIEMGRDLLQD